MTARLILAFLAAVIVTEVAMSVVSSNSVMMRLLDLGIEIPPAVWIGTMFEDVFNLAARLLPVLLVGFGIAFAVAALIVRYLLPGWGALGYPLAGAVTLMVVVFILGQIFQTHPFPVTRSLTGSAALVLCGAFGGWVFHLIGFRRGALESSPA